MRARPLHWVNSPVLFEAVVRYEEDRLPRSMKLWVERLLDINPQESSKLLPKKSSL